MERYEMEIVHACAALRDDFTGATGERLSDERFAYLRAWLEMRLREWHPPVVPQWSQYDDAVRSLAMATLWLTRTRHALIDTKPSSFGARNE